MEWEIADVSFDFSTGKVFALYQQWGSNAALQEEYRLPRLGSKPTDLYDLSQWERTPLSELRRFDGFKFVEVQHEAVVLSEYEQLREARIAQNDLKLREIFGGDHQMFKE